MENEQKDHKIAMLLVKKRKLLDLREELLTKSKSSLGATKEVDGKDEAGEGSPFRKRQKVTSPRSPLELKYCSPKSTLLSNEQLPTSPPPLSPLTAFVQRTKQKHEYNLQKDCSPESPYSNQPSISPPPFSPLTPPLLRAKKMAGLLSADTSMPDKSRSISPPLGSHFLITNNVNNNDANSSPIQPMSPETEKLYDVLTQPELDVKSSSKSKPDQEGEYLADTEPQSDNESSAIESEQDVEYSSDIIENSEIAEPDSFYEDSDDSVKDPDFDIPENKKRNSISESESESESESFFGDARENQITEREKPQTFISNPNSRDNKINENKSHVFNTTKEHSQNSIQLKVINRNLQAEKETQNLNSDPVNATINEREYRTVIPDIHIEDDTTNASLISKIGEQEDTNTTQNLGEKEIQKRTSTENTTSKQIENFISETAYETETRDINIEEKTGQNNIPSSLNDSETQRQTPENTTKKEYKQSNNRKSKSESEDDDVSGADINNIVKQQELISDQNRRNSKQSLIPMKKNSLADRVINTYKELGFDNIANGENEILSDENMTENLEHVSQSLISDQVDVTCNGNGNIIPNISIGDDTAKLNASLTEEEETNRKQKDEEENKKYAQGSLQRNIINKHIGNFSSSTSTETSSLSPKNNVKDNKIYESVASTSYDTGPQRAISEKKSTNKEYESLTPTVNENSTQSLALEEHTEEDIRNENAAIASTSEAGRKKKRRSRKQRDESKILRNTGKSYVTEKGKVVPDRQQEDLRNCRLKCAERITAAEQKQCFENYWKLGNRDRRAAFVAKSVTILPKKSQKTDSRTKNRDFYCVYKLTIANDEKPVCKDCFCRILGETKGFFNIIVEKKKQAPTGLIDTDQRGRQPPKNKKTIEDLTPAINHISSYPSYESHYCRQRTGKKYLPADLSIAKMYRDYTKLVSNPISLKLYAKCFHDLNLSFKQPSKDTCNTCDVLNAKIKTADEERKINLTAELTEHQADAEKAYSEKRLDKDIVKKDPSVRAFAFDLQQCLPTPYLKTSVSFYKRQLWSFNLTIHDLENNEATCYMWDETIGARGANQIASCLYHFCNNLPCEVKEVIFYSDTCGGQNKNNIVAMMFMYLLKNHPNLETVHHKFLISGHTHMECDSDHAIIEKTKKKTLMKINHLNDWVQLVRTCKIQKQFKVVVMTLKDFLDFSELKSKKGPFSLKKQDDSGQKFLWQPIKWLQYTKTCMGKIQFKHSLDREAPFKSVNYKKRGKVIDSFTLNPISQELLPISAEKKKDLMDLLELIDSFFHDFYINLKTVGCQPIDPDLDEENPDLED